MNSADSDSTANLFSFFVNFYASDPNIGNKKVFGFDCLRYKGELFLKLDHDEIAIKLSKQRIAELIGLKVLKPYQRGDGQLFKEWGILVCPDREKIRQLVDEAKEYSKTATRTRRGGRKIRQIAQGS